MSNNLEEKIKKVLRGKEIKNYIQSRVREKDTVKCIFYIKNLSRVGNDNIYSDLSTNPFLQMVQKYTELNVVDTVSGSWNLNDDWYETREIECIIEYGGVYPINWNIYDVVFLEDMVNSNKFFIQVFYIDSNGKMIPNN